MSDLDDVRDVAVLSEEELAVEKLRHSAAHVMAQAVTRLWPGTTLAIGPTIANGFYYDMNVPETLTADDLPKIEKEMRRVAKRNFKFEQEDWPKDQAQEFFKEDPFKLEIIDGLEDAEVSIYKQGEFTDLCRGPHLAHTGQLKHFKLLSVAGAYWRGDETKPMLTRIYGAAFRTAEELEAHLEKLEQARQRDHRKLGKELGLFSFHPEAPAMPFFHPKGTTVYNLLQEYVRGLYREHGYDEIVTPQIFDTQLWKTSGHYDNYLENMFLVDVDGREFGVKPMNCPSHCLLFSESKWSYRDLPVRFADFGRLHRYERSGVTQGLTRVRSMQQDDAHIFCTPDQVGQEIEGVIAMVQKVYADLGLGEPKVTLSTKPEKALGDAALWEKAESALREILAASGMDYEIEEGEGAFYGPKIDFFFNDVLDRPWQLSTIQLDFNLPERFELKYTNSESQAQRPVMIHRAVLGTLERFMGILIEHHAGAFPPWLAPVQARILPIVDELNETAESILAELKAAGLRAEADLRTEKLGKKIREAQLDKIPYQLVLGKREAESGQVALRLLRGGDAGAMPVAEFLARATKAIDDKASLEDA
ncbi:MAG: threonine--tRNA ligase [Acidobacteriota bacterium]